MNKIIKILMERDGISREEAKELYLDCKIEMESAIDEGRYSEAEDILADYLGLEIDYAIYILF